MNDINRELIEDRELLQQHTLDWADAGDERAVEGAYRLYGGDLLRLMGSKFGREKAEDIVQDTFAKAAEAIPQGMFHARGPGSLRNWLFTIAVRKGYDAYNRDPHKHEMPTEDLSGEVLPYMPASAENVEEKVIGTMMASDLLGRLDQPDFLDALRRMVVMGDSYKEYAKDNKISVGTAGSRLSRAKAWLRETVPAEEYI